MKKPEKKKTLISISEKSFLQVSCLLLGLLILSVALTYVVPKGTFGTLPDGSPDYLNYVRLDEAGGIPLWQGLLAPILVFFSGDGLSLFMLSLFLFVVSAAFQVMNDVGGIRSLVVAVSEHFQEKRSLLLVLTAFLFYAFGAFLGLFEEMLTMLPIVCALSLSVGFDSFTGFICSILACGFGFAGALTNPFTVLLASEIVGANPVEHIWFRIVIFLVMFGLLMGFLFLYLKKIKKDPSASLTHSHDERLREAAGGVLHENGTAPAAARRLNRSYAVFLAAALFLIVISSLSPALRGYTVVILTAYFLLFGIAAGAVASGDLKFVLKSFLRGMAGAAPTIVFIALAASIKFVFDKGQVLPTVVNQINTMIEGHSPVMIALIIYLIVLVLEFFISSSTAKAILVMGLLAMVNTGLTKPMLVLLYTFGDGYTNVIFPTSPVLLISLSMIEVPYFTWIKKSAPLFIMNLLLVVGFIVLGVVTGY